MIFSRLPPVFPARKTQPCIAHTVAGPMILSQRDLFFSIISSVCLSGIHSAIIMMFLKISESIASSVDCSAERKLAKFTRVSSFDLTSLGIFSNSG